MSCRFPITGGQTRDRVVFTPLISSYGFESASHGRHRASERLLQRLIGATLRRRRIATTFA
jgi:hypothetical protein